MKYKKINMGEYNIHLIKTNKFNTTTVSINFREKITKENITIRRLLFQMISSNSKKYNTNRMLQMELENLYSLSLGHANNVFGNVINSYIDFKFINEKYSEKDIFIKVMDLIKELIFNPNVKNNKFDKKQFNISKDLIETYLDSRKENTARYALNRSLELLDPFDPVSINLWGYKEDLDKITEEDLYKYYINMLRTNKIDIIVVGNFDEKLVLNLFKKNFILKNRCVELNYEPFITYNDFTNTLEKVEELNIKQSKLSIVCKILNLSIYERRYVLPVYTSILGGISTSRLFMNVREKHSLAYTISAMSKGPNSMFFITAGIDATNYEKTVKLINSELYLKNVTKEEIDNAKNEIIESLKTLFDDPTGIINYYFGIEVFNADTLNMKIENYNKVSKEDIINFREKIKVAMIYLLKGTKNEKEKN